MTLSIAAFLALVVGGQGEMRMEHRYVTDKYVALAIAQHESGLNPSDCTDEPDGSSSRGLMQLNHKDAHCDAAGDAKYSFEYEPGTNVLLAMRLLAIQHAWHLEHCVHPHDVLIHFAGSGPAAKRFAAWVRKQARELRAEVEKKHGRVLTRHPSHAGRGHSGHPDPRARKEAGGISR